MCVYEAGAVPPGTGVRIPVKPATESGANRQGRSEATLEVDNHLRGGRFESIPVSFFG